ACSRAGGAQPCHGLPARSRPTPFGCASPAPSPRPTGSCGHSDHLAQGGCARLSQRLVCLSVPSRTLKVRGSVVREHLRPPPVLLSGCLAPRDPRSVAQRELGGEQFGSPLDTQRALVVR